MIRAATETGSLAPTGRISFCSMAATFTLLAGWRGACELSAVQTLRMRFWPPWGRQAPRR